MQTETVTPKRSVRSCTMLSSLGDIDITWEDHNDAEMRTLFEQKMKEGIVFFEIIPDADAMRRRRKVTAIDQLSPEARKVSVPDPDIMKLWESGTIGVGRSDHPVKTRRRIKDPAEVATTDTAAVRQAAGG